ncbi:hypothetical protein [Cohnella sp. GbtcB17]|uniref:hypothetical protein n=1 Tax=Cohnella sp. GbtcB17 TaxID=2824762 RepID=UPI001C2F6B62|nr:hypothetical protein [Cohnella sp. GbtcB17]
MVESTYTTDSQRALQWLMELIDNDDFIYSPDDESNIIWLHANNKVQASIKLNEEGYRMQIYNKDWYTFADPYIFICKETNEMIYVEAIFYDVEEYGIQEEFPEDFEMEHWRERIESPEVKRLSQKIQHIYLSGRLMG